MLLKLIRYFKGYVTLRIRGRFTERFVNICMARGIIVWNIKKESDNILSLCMGIRDFMNIRSVAKKSRVRVKILKKSGARVNLRKYKKRKLFFIGLAVFVLSVFVMSRFIWHIEINGLTYTSEEQLLATLRQAGVYPGAPKSRLDEIDIKNEVLLKEDSLSWIWVDIRGTKAVVNVTQRKQPPEVVDHSKPYDIVAAKDGIVVSYTATSGTPLVKIGDSVLEGQTLISGVMNSDIIAPRYTGASGEVWARTWYTKSDVFSPDIYPKVETGNTKNYRTISIFGKDINLFFKKNPPYGSYNETYSESSVRIFGADTGIKVKNLSAAETVSQKKTLTEEELLAYAEERLLEEIAPQLSENYEQVAKNITFSKNSDGTYNVELTAEYKEQIGKYVPIEVPAEPLPDETDENTQ